MSPSARAIRRWTNCFYSLRVSSAVRAAGYSLHAAGRRPDCNGELFPTGVGGPSCLPQTIRLTHDTPTMLWAWDETGPHAHIQWRKSSLVFSSNSGDPSRLAFSRRWS